MIKIKNNKAYVNIFYYIALFVYQTDATFVNATDVGSIPTGLKFHIHLLTLIKKLNGGVKFRHMSVVALRFPLLNLLFSEYSVKLNIYFFISVIYHNIVM